MVKTSSQSTSSRLIPSAHTIASDSFKPFGRVIQNPLTHGEDGRGLEHAIANQGSAIKWLDVANLDNHYHLAPSRRPAKAVLNMFVCQPRRLDLRGDKPVFPVHILERHPYTPQTFIPLGVDAHDPSSRYLVIVAPTLPSETDSQVSKSRPNESPKQQPRKIRPARALAESNEVVVAQENWQPKGLGAPDLDNIQSFIVRGDQAVTYGPATWHAPMVVLGTKPIDFVVVQYANGVGLEDCQEVEITAADGGEGPAVVAESFRGDSPSTGAGIMRAKI